MTTGDLKGSFRKLEVHLRLIRYPGEVDYCGLAKGDPSSFLPLVSYAFISYSSCVAEHLVAQGVELTGKNDLRFVETVYKVLRDLFHYKPLLTKVQFFQFGFAERKIGILCDIISFVTNKHKELCKESKPHFQRRNKSSPPSFDPSYKTVVFPAEPDALPYTALTKRPLVERHIGGKVPLLTPTLLKEPGSGGPEKDCSEVQHLSTTLPASPGGDQVVMERPQMQLQECRDVSKLSALERQLQECQEKVSKLSTLERQLQECQEKVSKLSSLEHRLEVLEKDMAGKIVIDRQEWNNLESRVLLLETRLALSSVQSDGTHVREDVMTKQGTEDLRPDSPEFDPLGEACPARSSPEPPGSSDARLTTLTDAPKEGLKERLERIANMMKDTTSLLKSVEPSM